jgi:putative transposase
MLLGSLRSEHAKDVEIVVLRHQLEVPRRHVKRPEFRPADRALLAMLSGALPRRRWSSFLITPDTILRWHRRLVLHGAHHRSLHRRVRVALRTRRWTPGGH